MVARWLLLQVSYLKVLDSNISRKAEIFASKVLTLELRLDSLGLYFRDVLERTRQFERIKTYRDPSGALIFSKIS